MKTLFSLLSSLLLGLGFLFLISPILLAWFIHGDYNRYIWVIHGPYPFSSFGGGPFQLAMGSALLIGGIVSILLSLLFKKISK